MKFTVTGLDSKRNARYGELVSVAAYKHFHIESVPPDNEGPAAYLVGKGRLRVVYDELIVQFEERVEPAQREEVLERAGFREVSESLHTRGQWIVRSIRKGTAGERLLESADAFAGADGVLFAWPNSVSEYERASGIPAKARRWPFDMIGLNGPAGDRVLDEGDPGIVIAVLDDGVDIGHPSLASRVAQGLGRDFVESDTSAKFNDPRPKVKDNKSMEGSDYHGTLCAGLVCADGRTMSFLGVAPGCTLVGVRVMAGSELLLDKRLGEAIDYARGIADIISCSWNGGDGYPAVVKALNDTVHGRNEKGTAVFCATGNYHQSEVEFPAGHAMAISVGACDEDGKKTSYANFGPKMDFVAPSSNSSKKVCSTDVSEEGWGYNTGERGDPDGLLYDGFGRTSAATAIAAGVGALCLSANPALTADELRAVLQQTTDKVGDPADYDQHTDRGDRGDTFGYGCINAAKAIAKAKNP